MKFPYLVNEDIEEPKAKNGPDENVAQNSRNEVSWVWHHQGTIPEDGDIGPCQRCGAHGSVNESRVGVVSSVQRRQIEEVDHENKFSPVEVRADKEHNKGKVEQVVQDKVAANAGCGIDEILVGGEEVADVAALQDEQDNPEDGGDHLVEGEGGGIELVLVPDALADVVPVVRGMEGVVD